MGRYLGMMLAMIVSFETAYALDVTSVEYPIQVSDNFIDIHLPVKNNVDYQWFLKGRIHSYIRPISQHFVPNDREILDGPGIVVWHLQILSHAFQVPMEFSLEFECRQNHMIEPYQRAAFTLLTQRKKYESAFLKDWVYRILFGSQA